MLTTAQYAALKTELQTDPTSLGYAAMIAVGNDQGLAELVNTPQPTILLFREAVSADEVYENINAAEFSALTQQQLMRLQVIMMQATNGGVSFRRANSRQLLKNIFPNGGPTDTNLTNIAKRQGSRAEQVLQQGISVTPLDIAIALRGA
jgi:hypothetical protein